MDSSKVIYRKATIYDIFAITKMWQHLMKGVYSQVKNLEKIPSDSKEPERFIFALANAVYSPDWILTVAVEGKKICGFVMGQVHPYDYTGSKFGTCHFIYVDPECRNGAIGKVLLDSYIKNCIDLGAVSGGFRGVYNEKAIKKWRKRGYEPEFIIYRRVKHAN